jgi:hypothetical protein
MDKQQKLWSINRLSTELQRNQRTIARALTDVPADGSLAGRPAWHMATAISAMRKYEGGSNRFDGLIGVDSDDAVPPAIASAVDAVQDLVARMRSEESVECRRELLQTEGRRVGRLHELIESDLRARGAEYPTIYGPFFKEMFASIVAETMGLCEMQLAPDDGGGQ